MTDLTDMPVFLRRAGTAKIYTLPKIDEERAIARECRKAQERAKHKAARRARKLSMARRAAMDRYHAVFGQHAPNPRSKAATFDQLTVFERMLAEERGKRLNGG